MSRNIKVVLAKSENELAVKIADKIAKDDTPNEEGLAILALWTIMAEPIEEHDRLRKLAYDIAEILENEYNIAYAKNYRLYCRLYILPVE